MSKLSKITNTLALATFVVIALVSPCALAQDEGGYAEPDFKTKLFSREALLLETQEVASTVEALAALASNFPGSEAVGSQLCAKALAIALRLDGTHPAAVAANAALSSGEQPETVPGLDTLESIATKLWTSASNLESPEKDRDERVLQFCIVDIAREIDPSNLGESNRYPTRLPAGIFSGWSGILRGGGTGFVFPDNGETPAVVDGNPDKATDPGTPDVPDKIPTPANPTRTAQGSYRSVVAQGSTASLASIRGDLKAGNGTEALAIIFSDESGATSQALNQNRDTLVSALTELQGAWPQDGGVLVLSVDSANGDDTALLLPSALLADSLMRDRKLDPRTTALGFVAPEGSLMPVGRLFQRLKTLRTNEIDTILVPEENLPELQDMALLGELAPFFRFHIILVGSLKEAVQVASSERSEDYIKSLRDFKLIQDVAKDSVLTEMTGSIVVKTKLGNIVKLNPNHASADLLLKHGSGKLPKTLTRNGSLAALYRATGPVVKAVQSKGKADRAAVVASFETVTGIQAILEPETAALGEMMVGLLKDIGNHSGIPDKNSPSATELKKKIMSTWETVRAEYSRLKNSG